MRNYRITVSSNKEGRKSKKFYSDNLFPSFVSIGVGKNGKYEEVLVVRLCQPDENGVKEIIIDRGWIGEQIKKIRIKKNS